MLSYFVALAKTSPWTLYRHMLLHMYLYTHIYMHTALSVREVRPKAGWLLQILLVYSGFLPFSCQSLLFIQSSRCLLRVYSCFFRVLQHVDTVFKLGVLLFFLCIYVLNRTWTNVCPCRPTSGYPTVTWRNCNWAARPSTSLWADAPAEHHWWDALIAVQTQLWRKTWKHDCHEKL